MPGAKRRSGGHNAKPLSEHLLNGSYRADRHGPLDGGNLAVIPAAPAHLHAHDGDLDERVIARHLRGLSRSSRTVGRGVLREYVGWSAEDLAVLRLALEALDRVSACRKIIKAEGLVVRGKRGVPRPHPLIRLERQAAAFAVTAFKQLNLGDR